MDIRQARETMAMWLDMLADEIADAEVPELYSDEERSVVIAGRALIASTEPREHVAWLRWNGRTYVTCDSDSTGAFRVFREGGDA